jgi:PAS domain S-box-containing protein
VQDVTRQRAAEKDLRQSEHRFRLLVDAVEDYAIFMLDPTGHVTTWNAGAQRSKGYTADEIIGQHFRVFYPLERQAEGHPERELERALEAGRYAEEGWRIRQGRHALLGQRHDHRRVRRGRHPRRLRQGHP